MVARCLPSSRGTRTTLAGPQRGQFTRPMAYTTEAVAGVGAATAAAARGRISAARPPALSRRRAGKGAFAALTGEDPLRLASWWDLDVGGQGSSHR